MLPFTTTKVTISSNDGSGDRWETKVYLPSALHVPANISSPTSADRQTSSGDQEIIDMVLHLNPGVAISRFDQVTDEVLGDVYDVRWVTQRIGFGLEHTRCGLTRVAGIGE